MRKYTQNHRVRGTWLAPSSVAKWYASAVTENGDIGLPVCTQPQFLLLQNSNSKRTCTFTVGPW